jgi:hypothetical protein
MATGLGCQGDLVYGIQRNEFEVTEKTKTVAALTQHYECAAGHKWHFVAMKTAMPCDCPSA